MTNLEEAVANLLAAIKDTEEYREYSIQKDVESSAPGKIYRHFGG